MRGFEFNCCCDDGGYFTVYGYFLTGAHGIGNYTHTLGEPYSTEGLYELEFDSSYSLYTGALAVGNTVYISRRESDTNFASWIRSYDATTAATQWTQEPASRLELDIGANFRITGSSGAINENEIFAPYASGRLLVDSGGQTAYSNPLTTIEDEEWRFDLFASHDYPSCGATRVRLIDFEAEFVEVTTSRSGAQWRHSFRYEWTVKVAADFGLGAYDPAARRPTATATGTVEYSMTAPAVHTVDVTTSDQTPPATPASPTAESLDIRFNNNLWSWTRWASFSGYDGDWAGIVNIDPQGSLLYSTGFPQPSVTLRSPHYPATYRELWIGGVKAAEGNYVSSSSGLLVCAVAPNVGLQTTYVLSALTTYNRRLDIYHGSTLAYGSPTLTPAVVYSSQTAAQIVSVSAHWALIGCAINSNTPAPDGRNWSSLQYDSEPDDDFYFWFVHRENGEWQPWRWEDSTAAATQYEAPYSAGNAESPNGLFTFRIFLGDMVKSSVPDSLYGPPQDTFGIDPP